MKVYLSSGVILDLTTQEYNLLFPGQNTDSEKVNRIKHRRRTKIGFPRKGKSNWSAFLAKRRRQRKEEHENNPIYTKNCEMCNNSFIGRTRRAKFCSIKCKKEFLHQQYVVEKADKNNPINREY